MKAESEPEIDTKLLEQAKRLIDFVEEKKKLKMAISAKEILELEQTLKRIEAKGLKEKMPGQSDVSKLVRPRTKVRVLSCDSYVIKISLFSIFNKNKSPDSGLDIYFY